MTALATCIALVAAAIEQIYVRRPPLLRCGCWTDLGLLAHIETLILASVRLHESVKVANPADPVITTARQLLDIGTGEGNMQEVLR
jgi:hypothetical protein